MLFSIKEYQLTQCRCTVNCRFGSIPVGESAGYINRFGDPPPVNFFFNFNVFAVKSHGRV